MTTRIQPPAWRILSPPVAIARSHTQAKCTVCDARKATNVATSIVRGADAPTASALRVAASRFPAMITADSRAVTRTSIAACWASTAMEAIMLAHVRSGTVPAHIQKAKAEFDQKRGFPPSLKLCRTTIALAKVVRPARQKQGGPRDPLASRLSDQQRCRGGYHEPSGTAPDAG